MSDLIRILFAVIAALFGGLLFKKLRIPTPMLTGSIVGVAACTLAFPGATYFPAELKSVVQMASGAVIGSRISRKELHEMKRMFLPAVVLVTCLLAFNMVCTHAMYRAGIKDIPTAVFASAPGGISDMTLMAPDFGADPIYVAVIQFCRLLFVNAAFPSIILFIDRRKLYPAKGRPEGCTNCEYIAEGPTAPLYFTAALALCGGTIFKVLGIPAGAVLGSAVFVAFLNVRYGKIYMPSNMKQIVMLGIGCYVGVQMVPESLAVISDAAIPVLLLLLASMIYTYFCALLLYRCSPFDFTTCMLMCSPGGLNEMSLIADELGANAPKVAVMHSIRIICIVAFFYRLIPIMELVIH